MLKATLKPTSADAALPDGGLTNTRPELILVRFKCRALSNFFAVFAITIVIIIIAKVLLSTVIFIVRICCYVVWDW